MQTLGIETSEVDRTNRRKYLLCKASILVITFLAWCTFHATRKSPAVAKSIWNGPAVAASNASATDGNATAAVDTQDGWDPFEGPSGKALLGELDLAFLGTYAVCIFFSGHLGDRLDLRLFLAAGMFGSGVFAILMGMAYFWHIHTLAYFIIMSMCAGAFQSTGWPSVISVIANWSGKGKRGLTMGLWSTSIPLGNILGTVVASSLLALGWGWSFIVPGLMMLALGLLVLCCLVVHPADVGLASQQVAYTHVLMDDTQSLLMDGTIGRHASDAAIPTDPAACAPSSSERAGFLDAWRIPGVAAYCLCLLFSKLIGYTFMSWLPYYINSAPIGGRILTPKESGHLSTLFDLGGVVGGIVAGALADRTGSQALVAQGTLLLSVPGMWLYERYGQVSLPVNVVLMVLCGVVVNGPHGLITTCVSADLGNHESLQGNAKLQATVIAIIDGMGSVGGALGPLFTGVILSSGGFDLVFIMLELSAVVAALMLTRVAMEDWRRLRRHKG